MRRRTQRRLSEEEAALWSHVARSVRAYPGRHLPQPAEAPVTGAAAEPSAEPVSAKKPAQLRPGVPAAKPIVPFDRKMMTALKRGQTPLEAVIDLHGLRQDEAHARLDGFLRRAQSEGARTVLVITGKGADAPGAGGSERGVLRRVVPHWLRLPALRAVVMGFEKAGLRHGGEGALYVRLRRAGSEGAGARRP
jgi:DNA-nicking Smr family endonuclease